MTPLYKIVAPPTVSSVYRHVSATLYYCVVRGPQEFPGLPLNVAGFRVAEGHPGQYYKVPPTTPTGLWAGSIEPVEYLGSRLPDARFLTPEGAVLAYVDALRSSQEEVEADIVALGHAIAAQQAQRSAKEATHGAITAALDSIMGQFRTIPQITHERLEELATWLQPVIAVEPPTYACIATPNFHADFLREPRLFASENDLTLHEYATDIVYTHSPMGPSLAEVYACLDRDGRMPATPAFFTVAPPPVNDQRTRPDPHNPDGYYTRVVRFLRKAP